MYIPPVEKQVLVVKMTKLDDTQRKAILQAVLKTMTELGIHVTAIELENPGETLIRRTSD